MAIRKIIRIDEDKCNGCGDCIISCPEGALQIVNGKARLVKENYCDGLGACIGECPTGALTIEEREADEFDEEAVKEHVAESAAAQSAACPGSCVRELPAATARQPVAGEEMPSQLSHWPVQLTLIPPTAPFLRDADVLLTADCVPFAMPDFHARFLAGGHPVLVACPKLDDAKAYVDKLALMLQSAAVRSLTIIHLEVPCCNGLCRIVELAMKTAGQTIPVKEVTIGINGKVIAEQEWQ